MCTLSCGAYTPHRALTSLRYRKLHVLPGAGQRLSSLASIRSATMLSETTDQCKCFSRRLKHLAVRTILAPIPANAGQICVRLAVPYEAILSVECCSAVANE